MGLKKRPASGALKTSIRSTLRKIGPASKAQLLRALRANKKAKTVSVTSVTAGLSKLVKDGRVVKLGSRARARFRLAKK